MKRLLNLFTLCIGASVVFGASSFTYAQSDKNYVIEGDIGILSEYRFRGVSRSGNDPVVQGSLGLFHDNGFYIGVFGSSLSKAFGGFKGEAELFAGYGTRAGAYDLDFSISFDTFHGSSNSSGYGELRASIARDLGLIYLKGSMALAPDRREFGLGSSFYVAGDVELPVPIRKGPPLTLVLHTGYEDYEGPLSKWDWSTGLLADFDSLVVGVTYQDTNNDIIPYAGRRINFSIKTYF